MHELPYIGDGSNVCKANNERASSSAVAKSEGRRRLNRFFKKLGEKKIGEGDDSCFQLYNGVVT